MPDVGPQTVVLAATLALASRQSLPRLAPLAALLVCAGCSGPQSALDTAGRDAERLADLFGWMAGGALLIWLVVVGLAVYAIRLGPERHNPRTAAIAVLGGGVVLPTVVLAGLLAYGLWLMPDVLALPPAGGLKIHVTGEQWWWRVRYLPPDGSPIDLANEIRLPVNERIEIVLDAADVIHSFWIPPLGGKVDMIPGRTTRLALEPTRTGVFRGACAEYCGAAHALMNFAVVVMERPAFDAWLSAQAQPAAEVPAARGREVFLSNGCGACHAVRGTEADGVVGPDLTHVGGRLTLGAGILANGPDDFLRWMSRTDRVKPGVHMPSFGMLPAGDLAALAQYLDALE